MKYFSRLHWPAGHHYTEGNRQIAPFITYVVVSMGVLIEELSNAIITVF